MKYVVSDMHDFPDIRQSVGASISRLQRDFLEMEIPYARRDMACLRGAVDELPGQSSEAWSLVLKAVPEQLQGRGDAASAAETAVHQALTLYAVHQRGNKKPMHVTGGQSRTFGGAMGVLAQGRTASVKSRYDALMSAHSAEARMYHLRSLVGLLSTDAIPLDYGQLASDLMRFKNAAARNGVNRRWGRDFYRSYSRVESDED